MIATPPEKETARIEARVTIENLETGEVDKFSLTDGIDSYIVLCGSALRISHVQTYSNGTRIITLKKDDHEDRA